MSSTPSPQQSKAQAFRAAVAAATQWLEANAAAVDALNVYPVPDGDTGSNMLLTMRSGIAAVENEPDANALPLAQALAHGCLMGARGTSGVILSQICRGFAEGLATAGTLDAAGLRVALRQAATQAYRAVTHPVEGTMLTVMRAAAEAAELVDPTAAGSVVLQASVAGAKAALASTPEQLPVLKQAGVVDAGGQGLVLLLEGAMSALTGMPLSAPLGSLGEIDRDWLAASLAAGGEHEGWGYCTQFAVTAPIGGEPAVRAALPPDATSVLVVGDERALQVHLHTLDPGAALTGAIVLGPLHNIKVDNMSDQNAALAARRAMTPAPLADDAGGLPVVAVVPGEGLARVFRSLGAARIVSGGQSMNPSVQQLADAASTIPGDTVILLPNNPNVHLVCQRLHEVLDKRVLIVPSTTVVQGIAALLAGEFQSNVDELAGAMTEGMARVRSIEVTKATRTVTLDGVAVVAGHYVALLDRNIVACSPETLTVIQTALDRAAAPPGSLITLYTGEGVSSIEGGRVAGALLQRADAPTVEVVEGGQPHYPYLLSLES